MEVIIPIRIESESTHLRTLNQAAIIAIAFREEVNLPVKAFSFPVKLVRQFLNEGIRRRIINGMKGIEPQSIDMEFLDPEYGVLEKEIPDFIAIGTIEVDGLPPRGAVSIGKVWPEIPKIISLGPEVIIDDVKNYG